MKNNMKKRRNALGQFTREHFNITFEIPGALSILRALIVLILLLPWIHFLFYRIKILEFLGDYMEYIFAYDLSNETKGKEGKDKKNGGFF